MDSFTDKLIKDLNQSEEDAFRISRLAVLKETIKDIADDSPTHTIAFVMIALFFCFTTYGLVTSSIQIPQIEERIFQIFEMRDISVEELNQKDHKLSGVLENMEISFVELGEMAQHGGMVYYSRKPSIRFFIVDEYWSVVYFYVNDRLDSAYSKRRADILFSPITGACLLGVVIFVYKRYKDEYKEAAGL